VPLLAVPLLASALGACAFAGSVDIAPPPGDPTDPVCLSVIKALPSVVGGLAPRTTKPSSPVVSAWGTPPVVVSCGVDRPKDLVATSEVYTFTDIDWFQDTASDGQLRFTTIRRQVRVQVVIPSEDENNATKILGDVGPAVVANDPSRPDGSL
jgi:hypothetical protein